MGGISKRRSSRIPHGDAITIKLEGNAFTEWGTPHYVVHQAQEEFLNQFRRGGARALETPTNLEMTRSVVDALRRAGYTDEQSMVFGSWNHPGPRELQSAWRRTGSPPTRPHQSENAGKQR